MRVLNLFLALFAMALFTMTSSCHIATSTEESDMETQKNLSSALREQMVKQNGLTSSELIFCVFLLPEKASPSAPFILSNDFKDGNIKSLLLSVKTKKTLDISPVLNFKEHFNSLYLEACDINLQEQALLPNILTLKEVSAESLKSIPINDKVECLCLDKIDTELSSILPKFTGMSSLALRNYGKDVNLLKKEVPHLDCLIVVKGNFQRFSIENGIGLSVLYLDHFPLRTLDFLTGLKITELRIAHSQIDDFSPIATLPNLKKLYITDCPLSDISFLKGKNLDMLDIHGTPMAEKALPDWLEAKDIIKHNRPETPTSPNKNFFP